MKDVYSVAALGELLIDFTMLSADQNGYPTMAAHPGGAPANFLAALSKFGIETAFLGKVGDDTFGKLLKETLNKAEINTKGVITDEKVFTTLAFVTLSPDGDREFSFARKPGADTMLEASEIDFSIIEKSDVFHFGTLSMTDEPALSATKKAVAYAKEQGKLISFDPNLREPLWKNLNDAKEAMLWGLEQADVVKISDNEVDFLFSLSPEKGAEKIFADFGCKLIFVTCGKDGCVFKNRHAFGSVPGITGIGTVDTTGAGDIFGGSAMFKILSSGKAPEDLTETDLREICTFACVSAGLSTTKFGGIESVPSLEEILNFKGE